MKEKEVYLTAIEQRNIYMNNCKIYHLLRKHKALADGAYWEAVIGEKEGQALVVRFRISQNLSNFDLDVADAIYTLYYWKTERFSVNQIAKVLSGDKKQEAKGALQKQIIESIARMTNTTIALDCADHLKHNRHRNTHRYLTQYHDFLQRTAPFLHLEQEEGVRYRVPGTARFRTFIKQYPQGYFILPLHGYAQEVKQMVCVPYSLLYGKQEGAKAHANTALHIQIKRHLIRRMEAAYANQKQRKRATETVLPITYERALPHKQMAGMFANLDICQGASADAVYQKKRLRIHQAVTATLSFFQSVGYIKAFEVRKKERKIYGVTVTGQRTHEVFRPSKNKQP